MVKIYYSELPNGEISTVFCNERNSEISSCTNLKTKRQKYFVWKLLEFAVFDTFGKRENQIEFVKSDNGKWLTNICYFSLSHSENALAVAVSDNPVGVDIEKIKPINNGLAEKILNCEELKLYSSLSENEKNGYLIKTWTEKESYFKSLNQKSRSIINTSTFGKTFFNKTLTVLNEEYFLSAYCGNDEKVDLIFAKIPL